MFIALLGDRAKQEGFLIAQQLRSIGIETELDYAKHSLKSQMRRADKLTARYVLILGDDEILAGVAQFRDMESKSQSTIPLDRVVPMIKNTIENNAETAAND